MRMPGFTADVSLFATVGHYRAHYSPFTSHGAVLPEMWIEVTYNTRDSWYVPDQGGYFEDGYLKVGTISVSERGVPDGSGYIQSKSYADRIRRCEEECRRVYDAKKLACASASNPSACESTAYWEYWDCSGLCHPV
jgi:hypothetical protein